jgi:protoporphyrin/coproporphyrin ferrochelatase
MTTGVLLMTYGAATTPEDVPAYLDRVYKGNAPQEVVDDFVERARLVGGSPLVEITRGQAAGLQEHLGDGYRVEAGMRHTPPFLADGLGKLAADGVDRIVAIVMSPQFSPHIMGGYVTEVEAAHADICPDLPLKVAGPWNDLPSFLDALTDKVREALEKVPADERATVPLIITSHSLPERVVEREQDYLDQMTSTARGVVERLGIADDRWQWAYQSAGHSPEPWLEPDMKDLLPGLAAAGHRRVLMVPVQFLADHLETLYDIDVAAAEEAREAGLVFQRIEMFNTDPAFIGVLADVVRREEA